MKCYRSGCQSDSREDSVYCSEECRNIDNPGNHPLTFEEKLAVMKTWKSATPDVDKEYVQQVLTSLT